MGTPFPFSRPGSIPFQRTPLIGRKRECELVRALLLRDDVPLVTLTGPGGAGKTRLAFQVSHDLADVYADGVVLVLLAPIRDPGLVPATIAHALGLPDAADRPSRDHLQAFLRDRHLLLVLDNFEHLLEAAPLTVELLEGSPRLTILCTSRARLVVSSEHVFPVGSLSSEAAKRLFADRAQAQDPAFALTDETSPVVDTICARLDGLPLALELAASRIAVLSPVALLARLDRQLDVLTGGPRDATERHRGLRETIRWSHALLAEDEQTLFRRLGVFRGGFTMDAAVVVMGSGQDVLPGITALASHSLIERLDVPGGEDRFGMLESILEYAQEQLAASGEEQSTRHAHAHHFAERADQIWTAISIDGDEAWAKKLRPDLDNFRAALAWTLEHEPVEALRLASALEEYWSIAEGRDWLERSLAEAPDAPVPIRARALAVAGWLALRQVDIMQADRHLTEAVALSRSLEGNDVVLGKALACLGGVALAQGDLERARQFHDEELRIAQCLGYSFPLAIGLLNQGRLAAKMGNLAQAQAFLEESLAVHQRSPSPTGQAVAHVFLGSVSLEQGDRSGAASHYLKAFSIFAGDWTYSATAMEGLVGATIHRQPVPGVRLLGAATAARERIGHPREWQDHAPYERTLSTARALLSDVEYDEAWAAGQRFSDEDVTAAVDNLATLIAEPQAAPVHSATRHGLSKRETEVLAQLVEGRSNRAIAANLSVSERTVENHVMHILNKLGMESRTAATAYAIRHGLV